MDSVYARLVQPMLAVTWNDCLSAFENEVQMYLFIGSILFSVYFALFCCAVGLHKKYWQPRQFSKAAFFFGLLLLTSALADGIWYTSVNGCLYANGDYCLDFSPFCPLSPLDFDPGTQDGLINGATWWSTSSVWLLFTVVVWSTTFCLYRSACGKWPFTPRQIMARRPFWNSRSVQRIAAIV
jgi:hypothetical protein